MDQRVIEALTFYAATESYASANSIPDVMRDGGQRAKAALQALGLPLSVFEMWLAKHNVLKPMPQPNTSATPAAKLRHDLRRLAGQLRQLHPCICKRNKGLSTHPLECPAHDFAEEWRIAGELDQLAGRDPSACRVCGITCDSWPLDGSGAICPKCCDDHDYEHDRERQGKFCKHCDQPAPADWGEVD